MTDSGKARETDFSKLRETIERGGAIRYHEAAAARGKLFARERIALLTDEGSFTEDGRYANALADGLPADGVITGTALVDGRPVALMANDSTVKAGSWGARTVEKIIRIIEKAYEAGLPMIYLVDSAGARITDQVDMFPGRRGAGRIFRTQIRASGSIPQVCALFGPSAAGGAYIPAFCDFTAMVDGNASMYLGSPRMVEMVVSEKTTLEEMGGARLHCTVSGSGHLLAASEQEALAAVRDYLSYLPQNWSAPLPAVAARDPKPADLRALVPERERQAFDMRRFVRGVVDEDSFFEIHALWARELVTGFARLDGQVTGVIANNPMFKGGVLFVDSADKAARFIQTCDAFGIPLLFLADVPGFMVGTAVERQGIIRHGAKMIAAMSDATVPKICVVAVRHGGPRLRAGRHARPAHGQDRGHGRRGRGQRRVREQARADRRRDRAGRRDRTPAPRLRAGHRHPAPRLRTRRGRRGRARGPARRAGPPVRRRPRPRPHPATPPPRHQPRLTNSA
jgi:acetyl-CoA carboxylase carboxyltransferase component